MKSRETENDVTDIHLGRECDTVSSYISSPAPTEAATPSTTASGDVEDETVVTPDATTPGSSSPLSDAEAKTLARIRKDRRNGFMVSAVDVDFLLELIGRLMP